LNIRDNYKFYRSRATSSLWCVFVYVPNIVVDTVTSVRAKRSKNV